MKYFVRGGQLTAKAESLKDIEGLLSLRSIGQVVHVSSKRITRKKGGFVKKWTVEDDLVLRDMYFDQAPIEEIAHTLNRTIKAITCRMQVQGLKKSVRVN